jgi:chromosome segregation ATPase
MAPRPSCASRCRACASWRRTPAPTRPPRCRPPRRWTPSSRTLARLQELGKDTEARLSSLNALAEHVSHKARALETQKATVEHAVVEATRLNEMVWTMDAQIAKISDGKEQLQRTEETVARMEQLAQTTAQELAAATAAREAFLRESVRLEAQGRTLADGLRAAVERLTLDRQEVDAFDQRLKALSGAVGETELRMHGVLARDENFAALQRQADTLGRGFDALTLQAEGLARQQLGLDTLVERLGEVDALSARTAARHQGLLQSQQELDTVRRDLAAFHTAYAEAAQLRDKLALDRSALETFAERTAGMLSRTPELEARLDAVLGKLAQVDAGSQAAERLAEVAAGLDAQLTRVSARMQFVELLDQRVNGLHALTAEVERRHAEQLARRAEVEGLQNRCDTLGAQIVDAQQKLDGVGAAQARLLPMTDQVAALTQTLQSSQQQLATLKQDEAVVREQQARLAELVESGRQLGAEAAERLRQVQAANDDLGRATALKEALLAELAQVQARQREAIAQTDVADDQLRRAEAMTRQLEQRRTQLQSHRAGHRRLRGAAGRAGPRQRAGRPEDPVAGRPRGAGAGGEDRGRQHPRDQRPQPRRPAVPHRPAQRGGRPARAHRGPARPRQRHRSRRSTSIEARRQARRGGAGRVRPPSRTCSATSSSTSRC